MSGVPGLRCTSVSFVFGASASCHKPSPPPLSAFAESSSLFHVYFLCPAKPRVLCAFIDGCCRQPATVVCDALAHSGARSRALALVLRQLSGSVRVKIVTTAHGEARMRDRHRQRDRHAHSNAVGAGEGVIEREREMDARARTHTHTPVRPERNQR